MHTVRHILLLLTGSLLLAGGVWAQRISFGLYASDDLFLTPGSVDELNFNTKQTIILAGNTVQILLTDDAVAVLTIDGRTDLDVTITIDAPSTIDLDVDNKIPFTLRFAYSNLGAIVEGDAKTQAIEIPAGFTSATFPINRRTTGPPLPPPTPDHTGYTAPTGRAWLFIYGTLGPVPQGAAAGLYSGEINVSVSYSVYN